MKARVLAGLGALLPARSGLGAKIVGCVLPVTLLVMAGTQDAAHAFALPPPAVTLPTSIVDAAMGGGGSVGVITGGGGGSAATGGAAVIGAAAVPLAVAAAGLAVGYGIGTAITWGWKSATGAATSVNPTPGYADPPPAGQGGWVPGQGYATNYCYASSCTYNATTETVGFTGTVPVYGQTSGTATFSVTASAQGQSAATYITANLDFKCKYPSTTAGTVSATVYGNTAGFTAAGSLNVGANCAATGLDEIALRLATGPVVGHFYPQGHSLYVAPTGGGAAGSTVLTTTPTAQCSGGGTAAGTPVTYTGATLSANLPILTPGACPAGQARTGVTFPTTGAGGATVPSPIPALAPVVPSGYALCQSTAGKVCVLTLLRHNLDGSLLNCGGTSACAGWSTRAVAQGVAQVQTKPDGTTQTVPALAEPNGDYYECKWGSYTIPTLECTTVPTEPKVPATAEDNCDGSGFSFNPVSWVVVPLKCLFIPDQAKMNADYASVSGAWGGSAPGAVGAAVGTIVAPVVGLAGTPKGDCQGPLFAFNIFGADLSFRPFSACSESAGYASNIALAVESFFVYGGAAFLTFRMVTRTIGLNTPEEA